MNNPSRDCLREPWRLERALEAQGSGVRRGNVPYVGNGGRQLTCLRGRCSGSVLDRVRLPSCHGQDGRWR
jgi:hypothetical protein